jgi:hypothetical protein
LLIDDGEGGEQEIQSSIDDGPVVLRSEVGRA